MKLLFKYATIFTLSLIVLVFAISFILYLTLKIILLLLIILMVNSIFKEKEEILRRVAMNDSSVTAKFKIRNIFKFLLAWTIYFSIISFVLRGISINIISEFFTCFVQLYFSFIYTRNGYKRIVENYFNGRVEIIFPEGLMFYPGVWFFYFVSNPIKIFKHSDGSFTFFDEDKNPISDENGNNKININLDSTNVLRGRKISGIEDFIYTVFINNPKFRNSISNLDSRRILSSVFLTIIIMIISFSFNGIINKSFTVFNPNTGAVNSFVTNIKEVSKKVKKSYSTISFTSFFDFKSEDIVENEAGSTANSVNIIKDSTKSPIDEYDSTRVWSNLKSFDNFTVIADIPKDISYIEEEGFIPSLQESKNYFPQIYIDGFPYANNFFAKFFRVHIYKLVIEDIKKPWQNIDMDLVDYISLLSIERVIYRDIKIIWDAKLAGIYEWHIITAGVGYKNLPFKVSFGKERRISIAERKRLGI